MANFNISQASFMNLFPDFVYDKEQVSSKSLDIWNAYRLKYTGPDNKDSMAFYYRRVRDGDTLISLAREYYSNDALWWLILESNNAEDPFTFLDDVREQDEPTIRILKEKYISEIVYQMVTYKELSTSANERNGDDA
jgi:hypothetical protein